MRRENVVFKKRFLLIALFVALIAGISFGFAYLQTTLTINGSTTIKKVGWLVHFKNLSIDADSYTNPDANNNNAAQNYARIVENDTKVEFGVTLKQPGDFYEFEFDIANDGTLDAKLKTLTQTGTGIAPDDTDVDNLAYFSYSITGIPAQGSVLAPGSANYEHVVIRVEYPADIDPEDLPGEDFTFERTIVLNYEQDGVNGN